LVAGAVDVEPEGAHGDPIEDGHGERGVAEVLARGAPLPGMFWNVGSNQDIPTFQNMAARQRVLGLAGRSGVIRPGDLRTEGIAPVYLTRLVRSGELVRVGRGLYSLAGGAPSANRTVVEASRQLPRGVICLLSALRLHGLTTQMPATVWIAIGVKARRPRAAGPPLEIVRMSGRALTEGVEERILEGVRVRVYVPAKTVADCFKFRNKVGLDVALEALRDYRRRRGSVDELLNYAEICRVARVMRPYLEALS
jgi:predicted transcriptional regulator of viral defense system